MAQTSRRGFVLGGLGVPVLAGVWRRLALQPQGLGDFTGAGPPPCTPDAKPTPAAPEGQDFKAKSPERTSLVEPGIVGTPLRLIGTVSGVTCGVIAHALVDFWQADLHGVYDRDGFRLRGHQYTDGLGAYHLETIVPGASGTGAPRIHVKVQPPGKPVFTTQLFVAGAPQNKIDPAFRPELALRIGDSAVRRGGKVATFNILLNI